MLFPHFTRFVLILSLTLLGTACIGKNPETGKEPNSVKTEQDPDIKGDDDMDDTGKDDTDSKNNSTPLSTSFDSLSKSLGTQYLTVPPYVNVGQKMPAYAHVHGAAYLDRNSEGLRLICAGRGLQLVGSEAFGLENETYDDDTAQYQITSGQDFIALPRLEQTETTVCTTNECVAPDPIESMKNEFHLIYYYAGSDEKKGLFENLKKEGMPETGEFYGAYKAYELSEGYQAFLQSKAIEVEVKEDSIGLSLEDDSKFRFPLDSALHQGMILENERSALRLYFSITSHDQAIVYALLMPNKETRNTRWMWGIETLQVSEENPSTTEP